MKSFWNSQASIVFGSANITGRGLGEVNNYNLELNGLKESISLRDIIYLNQVIASSEYVSKELYDNLYDNGYHDIKENMTHSRNLIKIINPINFTRI